MIEKKNEIDGKFAEGGGVEVKEERRMTMSEIIGWMYREK